MPQSHELRVLLADNQAGTTNAISLAARNCDLLGDQTFGFDPGKRGSRDQYACGSRVLREVCAGGFDIYPTAAQIDWFIQRMIGNNIAGFPSGSAVPGETLPAIYAYIDKGDELFRYDELRINEVIISIRESDYINWRINFIGKDETSGVTWPASPPAIACASEYVASDVALTFPGPAAFNFKQFDLNINNGLAAEDHDNNLKRTRFEPGPLNVTGSLSVGYRTDTKALYRRGVAGDDQVSLAMNDGTTTYTIVFGNMKIPGRGPVVQDEGQIPLNLDFVIRRTAALPSILFLKS